jgi:DNA-binding SARP family transcriptional activator
VIEAGGGWLFKHTGDGVCAAFGSARAAIRFPVVLVRVLGAAGTISGDDVDVRLRPMERKLVAALAVRRPAAVSADSLIEALWPDLAPVSARKTVQNNVLRVRRKLGAMTIETIGDGYRLGEMVDTDLARFERAMCDRDPRRGPTEWDEVLCWCPERPLDDLRDWGPAGARRAELEELRSSAVEARWEAALRGGDARDVVSELEALVGEAPLRECRWRLLLAAYQRAGRRAEGLRAFERARRTLAVEIGVPPGLELVEAYEALLRDVAVRLGADTREMSSGADFAARSDEQRATAIASLGRGDAAAAVRGFAEAARLARAAGDRRRFAEAALAASGDGWRTGFDATADVVTLLGAALAMVPPAPTPLRSRLLARSAVVRSHHVPGSKCEAQALKALAIARAVGDPGAVAAALHALTVVVWDPSRRQQHRAWLDELLHLAALHSEQPYRRWAAPILARVLVLEGDITSAGAALDRLGEEAAVCADTGAAFAASHAAVLRASVAGDWPAARTAVKSVCAEADAAGFDPAGTAMHRLGLLGIIGLLAGPADVAPLPPIEWPLPSMELSVAAWHANCQARAGQIDQAVESLNRIDPATILEIERDGYWLATLSMLADAAFLTRFVTIAGAVADCLNPLTDLTIVDPGLIYRGAAAHFAGLAVATCGDRAEAVRLLSQGLAAHETHGSAWMTARSREMLAAATN